MPSEAEGRKDARWTVLLLGFDAILWSLGCWALAGAELYYMGGISVLNMALMVNAGVLILATALTVLRLRDLRLCSPIAAGLLSAFALLEFFGPFVLVMIRSLL